QLDDVGVAVALRELDEAERVARGIEAKGFRIDRDAGAEIDIARKIVLVQRYAHLCPYISPCFASFGSYAGHSVSQGRAGGAGETGGAQERTRTFTALRPQV